MGVESYKPYIAMICAQCIFAGLALFSKAAMTKGMNAYVFVVYRQALATLVLAPFAFFLESKKSAPLSYILLCKIFFSSLFGVALCLNLYTSALKYAPATVAAVNITIIPVITLIMAVSLKMETISMKEWHGIAKVLGCLVCVCGAVVFTFAKGPPLYSSTQKQIPEPSTKHTPKGDWIKGSLIMLSANTTWALWLIMLVPLVKQYPAKLRLTALQCFFSCMQSAIWAVAMERNMSSWKLGWDINLVSVVYCGIIVTGITYWLRVWVIEKKGPVFTALFNPLSLVITAILSVLFFEETLHLGSLLGAILLVGGLYIVLWGKHKEGKNKETNEQRSETKEETTLECITHK
uniref:WAT1-related protein n=1 Tax=Davidia involucrata TaxID=16924 RepID=A0A5B7BU17_DAVIN